MAPELSFYTACSQPERQRKRSVHTKLLQTARQDGLRFRAQQHALGRPSILPRPGGYYPPVLTCVDLRDP